MIKSVKQYTASALLNGDEKVLFKIPRYQREYSWGKSHWERIFDDLAENSNGYFLGSIICINQSDDALSEQLLELVDGQQRLTTLSLLFAAIYSKLFDRREQLDDEQKAELISLKYRLLLKKTKALRLELQSQNNNDKDFQYALALSNISGEVEPPANAGNRRIVKAFRYFEKRIDEHIEINENPVESILDLLDLIKQSILVKIEVSSHADAYVLFESLNNRGAPLTAVDLIKNKILAQVSKEDDGKVDSAFNRWTQLLSLLPDDYATQERFLRHYYNAFSEDFKEITKVAFTTKSQLIFTYEKLINNGVFNFLDNILDAGKAYSKMIGYNDVTEISGLEKQLTRLDHIQGTPSLMLLMYLYLERCELQLLNDDLVEIVKLLVKFFVRRNLTDMPATRELDRIFVGLINKIRATAPDSDIVSIIRSELKSVSAPLDRMEEAMDGDIYLDNPTVTRFLLCSLEEDSMTKETVKDLWALGPQNKYIWTIEHIFPQGQHIPDDWVDMIASGDTDLAVKYRDQYVHKLGNLTISGFNSTLSNLSFDKKRDRKDKEGRPVGYQNGLHLNKGLADKPEWTVEDIIGRSNKLKSDLLKMFAFKGEKITA